MTHYICPGGCGGEAENPGVCQAQDCLREGMPLEACECQDGKHGRDDGEDSFEAKFER